MDSFEWNKILGAILGTLLFLFVVKEVADIIYHPAGEEPPEEMAYKIEIPEGGVPAAGPEEPKAVDFGTLLQQASAQQGESVAKRCLQCHTFEKGGANKTGPNLWGVLGRAIAADPNFRYSNALSQKEGEWTYENVYEFVGAPSRWAPGTNMNFAGLRRQQERINLLAYLRTQADNPPPIPEPLPEETEEGAEAPEGEAAPAAGEETEEEGAAEGTEEPAGAEPEAEDAGAAGGEAESGEAAGEEKAAPGEDDASEEPAEAEREEDAPAGEGGD